MRMAQQQPAFVDITWTAGGKTGSLSIQLARFCRQHGLNAQMHLSAAGMDEAGVRAALDAAREAGIVNILALRGDVPVSAEPPAENGDGPGNGARQPPPAMPFPHAVDLVRFIRAHYGDAFCIGVAGYPEGHVDSPAYEADLGWLAEKVTAGGEYILTQQFFNVGRFEKFLTDCRRVGAESARAPSPRPPASPSDFAHTGAPLRG